MRKLIFLGGALFLLALFFGPRDASGQALSGKRESAPAEVHVVGVYEGAYPAGVQHGFNYHPQGRVKVDVRRTGRPIILVLTAYEPVLWEVTARPGVHIEKIILSGYHLQRGAGLATEIPTISLTYEGGDENYFYAYSRGTERDDSQSERDEHRKQYAHLVGEVRKLTDLSVKTFQGRYSGKSFVIR